MLVTLAISSDSSPPKHRKNRIGVDLANVTLSGSCLPQLSPLMPCYGHLRAWSVHGQSPPTLSSCGTGSQPCCPFSMPASGQCLGMCTISPANFLQCTSATSMLHFFVCPLDPAALSYQSASRLHVYQKWILGHLCVALYSLGWHRF